MSRQPRSLDLTRVSEWRAGKARQFQDYLVAEEPLEIRVGSQPLLVVLRTPGDDLELVAGFLFTEGLVRGAEEILSLAHAADVKPQEKGNVVLVGLATHRRSELARAQRYFLTSSSCGVCGKASIESVRLRRIAPPSRAMRLDPELLCALPEKLRHAQTLFGRTGGLHAAALFDSRGELVALREDVGRHNAVDKIVGWALVEKRLPLSEFILMVSGRGGFEIVQKALAAGVPVVASISAPSGLAVRLAREMQLTLIGFLRGRRFLVYSGEDRVPLPASSAAATCR